MSASRRACGIAAAALALLSPATAQVDRAIAPFSRASPGEAIPAAWTPLTFPRIPRHTRYSLVRDADAGVVLRADAASVQTFKQSLGEVCTKAKQACANVGIELMRPSDAGRYRAVLDAYAKSAP